MTNEEIRNRIKARRKEQQLSQADLAEKLSISQTAYYKIEKGNTGLISDHLPISQKKSLCSDTTLQSTPKNSR